MRGQGRLSKKARVVDLTLDEGDDEDDTRGAVEAEGAEDNLPGNGKHPLLNESVMEVLFKQYLLLKPRDDRKSALSCLAELRVVCKTWNEGISKVIRKETGINVNRLVDPYPKGLGWAPVVTIREAGKDYMLYEYSAPLPSKEIGPIENLDVTPKNCEDLSSPVLKWFQILGSSVKRLRFTCPLDCYHQTRFIEKILKEWCPNLESLTLRGIQSFDSLMQTSHFAKPTPENYRISLKEFVLDAEKMDFDRWSSACGEEIDDFAEDQPIDDLSGRQEICAALSNFVVDLISYVDQAGGTLSVNQEKAVLSKLVKRPIGLSSLDEVSPLKFGSHVPDSFQAKFSSDSGYETDGGLFGQLMKMAAVEKLVVQKAKRTDDHIRLVNELFVMPFYRPNLWRGSLKHLECEGNFAPITSVFRYINDIDYQREWRRPKVILSKVGFQLKSLKLNMMSVDWGGSFLDDRVLLRLLNSFAESLEELELATTYRRNGVSLITLPIMPKLKVLVVNCEKGYRLVRVTSVQLIGKLPMLERCVLGLGEDGNLAKTSFFRDNPKIGQDGSGRSHPLKELKLLDEYLDGRDIERMRKWFPNVEKAELSIVRDSEEGFKGFWEKMGKLPRLEQLKVNFSTRMIKGMDYGNYEKAIADNIGKFKVLQSLELEHEADDHTFPLTSKFSNMFAKARKLRFLKFTNFQTTFYGQVSGKQEQEIKEGLCDVVVELPAAAVRSSSSARMTRERATKK